MESRMFFNNIEIVSIQRQGKINWVSLANGKKVKRTELISPYFSIECCECKKQKYINCYHGIDKKIYFCQSCSKLGERNGFFGKKHTEEYKQKRSQDRKGKWKAWNKGIKMPEEWYKRLSEKRKKEAWKVTGPRNPFYGKTHTEKTKQILSQKSKQRYNNLTEEEKQIRRQKQSQYQKILMAKDPIKYSEQKRKAALCAAISPKKYIRNKIETIVENKLKELNLLPEYGVVLGYKQYDFGFKKERILLEVQGDYWHGNPLLFNEEGTDGKKKLNNTQKLKREKDIEKYNFAIENGFKIYYIWERDILNNNFKVLEEINKHII
jgi:very-short-patch-repair endonuclease